MNTGRAVADCFPDGVAVTYDVVQIAAVGEAGNSEPVGDEAIDDGAVDGAVVDASLVVVAAALLGMTSLERASGVPQATIRQPASTASEIIGHRHKLFTITSPVSLERSIREINRAMSTSANSAPPHQHDPGRSTCGSGVPTVDRSVTVASTPRISSRCWSQLSIAIPTQTWRTAAWAVGREASTRELVVIHAARVVADVSHNP